MNIGLFGGTFNPPHRGHEKVGEVAMAELGLDRLLIVPNRTPTHKDAAGDPGAQARLAMCAAMCADHPGWEACDWELTRTTPSWTDTTLRQFADVYPDANRWFICGADSAHTMPRWHNASSYADLAQIAVVGRRGEEVFTPQDRLLLQEQLPGVQVTIVREEGPEVSSTFLREELRLGVLPALLPERVQQLILREGYYGEVLSS